MYLGLKGVPRWILQSFSVYYIGTWSLRVIYDDVTQVTFAGNWPTNATRHRAFPEHLRCWEFTADLRAIARDSAFFDARP